MQRKGYLTEGLSYESFLTEVTSWADSAITFKIPSGVTPGGVYKVYISRSGRLADTSNKVEFTVNPLQIPATLTGISANSGTKGDTVRFYGTGLSGAYQIFIFSPDQHRCSGGEVVSPEATSDTEISFRIPELIVNCDYLFYVWVARADGTVEVLIWAKLFRYFAPPPPPIIYKFGIGLPFVSK